MGHNCPDTIVSALMTPAPQPDLAGRCGMGHWQGVCTVYTETGGTYLVTGYDNQNPRLSACRASVPVKITSIYQVFERDHPAIAALGVNNQPHVHYTGAA